MDGTEGVSSVATVSRALDFLAAVLTDGDRLSVGAIAKNVGLPISTAHRLVATFVRQKLIVRMARGQYVAAYRVAMVGGDGPARRGLALVARPALRRLAIATRSAAHLGVLDGDMVTYLIKEQTTDQNLFTLEGMQLEAYCSAIGKVLLAHLADIALARYFAGGPLVPLTAWTITDEIQLRTHLGDVVQNDHAIDNREVADDLFCVAVPIRANCGSVIAAISCSMHPERWHPNAIALTKETARAIESCL